VGMEGEASKDALNGKSLVNIILEAGMAGIGDCQVW
jgi:hypothetical protein